ncbi:hypothetical protein BIY23_00965 [Wolbachia pipientis]|uniref:OTU domain-containing protein n=1 Tax=Wolbachia pipientis TaxID=955 RepID=A0A1E7QLF3_WOLPI|nr:hypothetical protein [Wolbachia pipientis]OEY87044.1 hypothetical protein BIY23_00965 [Wolbachia pipientis]
MIASSDTGSDEDNLQDFENEDDRNVVGSNHGEENQDEGEQISGDSGSDEDNPRDDWDEDCLGVGEKDQCGLNNQAKIFYAFVEGHKYKIERDKKYADGDCFFHAWALSLSLLDLGLSESQSSEESAHSRKVKKLRETCAEEAKNDKSVKEDVIKEARNEMGESGDFLCDEEKESGSEEYQKLDNDIWSAYLHRIKFTAEEINAEEIKERTMPQAKEEESDKRKYGDHLQYLYSIWGRAHIEGEILCKKFNRGLHLTEILGTDESKVILHELYPKKNGNNAPIDVHKKHTTGTIEYYKAVFKDDKIIHVLNEDRFHFMKIHTDTQNKVKSSSDKYHIQSTSVSQIPSISYGAEQYSGNSTHSRIVEQELSIKQSSKQFSTSEPSTSKQSTMQNEKRSAFLPIENIAAEITTENPEIEVKVELISPSEILPVDITTATTVKVEALSPTSDRIHDVAWMEKYLKTYLEDLSDDVKGYVEHSKVIKEKVDSDAFANAKAYLLAATEYDMNMIADLLLTCRLQDVKATHKDCVAHAFLKQEMVNGVSKVYSNLEYIIKNTYAENRLIVFLGMHFIGVAHALCLDIDLPQKTATIYHHNNDELDITKLRVIEKYLEDRDIKKIEYKGGIGKQISHNCINMTIETIQFLLDGSCEKDQARMMVYHLALANQVDALCDKVIDIFNEQILKDQYTSCYNSSKKMIKEYDVKGGILHFFAAYALFMDSSKKNDVKAQYELLTLLTKAYSISYSFSKEYFKCLGMLMLHTEYHLVNGLDCINKKEIREKEIYQWYKSSDINDLPALMSFAEFYLQKNHYKQAVDCIDQCTTIYQGKHSHGVNNDIFFLQMKLNINMREYHSAYDICLKLTPNDLQEAYRKRFSTIISKLIKGLTSFSEHEKVMELFKKFERDIAKDDYIYKSIALVQSSLSLKEKEALIDNYNRKAKRKVVILTIDDYVNHNLANNNNDIYCIKDNGRGIVILTTEACMIENIGIPRITQLYYRRNDLKANIASYIKNENLILRLSRRYYEHGDGANINIKSFIENEFIRMSKSLESALCELQYSQYNSSYDMNYIMLQDHVCGREGSIIQDKIYIMFEKFLHHKNMKHIRELEASLQNWNTYSYEYVLINYFIALHYASNILHSLDKIKDALLKQYKLTPQYQSMSKRHEKRQEIQAKISENADPIDEDNNSTSTNIIYLKNLIEESTDDSVGSLESYFKNMQIVINSHFPYLKHQAYLCTGKILESIYLKMLKEVGRPNQIMYPAEQISHPAASTFLKNMLTDCSMYFNQAKEMYPNIASSYVYLAILYNGVQTDIKEHYKDFLTNTIYSMDYLDCSITMQCKSMVFLEPHRQEYKTCLGKISESMYAQANTKLLDSLNYYNDNDNKFHTNNIKKMFKTESKLFSFFEQKNCNSLVQQGIHAILEEKFEKALVCFNDTIFINDNVSLQSHVLRTYVIYISHCRNTTIEIKSLKDLREKVEDYIQNINANSVSNVEDRMKAISDLYSAYKKMLKLFYTIEGDFYQNKINVHKENNIECSIINAFLYLYPYQSSFFKYKIDYDYTKLGLQRDIYKHLHNKHLKIRNNIQDLLSPFYLGDYNRYIKEYTIHIADTLRDLKEFDKYVKHINFYIHSVYCIEGYNKAFEAYSQILEQYNKISLSHTPTPEQKQEGIKLKKLLLLNLCLLSIKINAAAQPQMLINDNIAKAYTQLHNLRNEEKSQAQESTGKHSLSRTRNSLPRTRIVNHISDFILSHANLPDQAPDISMLANDSDIGVNNNQKLHISYYDIEMYLCYLILIKFDKDKNKDKDNASVGKRLTGFLSKFREYGLDIKRVCSSSRNVKSELRFLWENISKGVVQNIRGHYGNEKCYKDILSHIRDNIDLDSNDYEKISHALILINTPPTPPPNTPLRKQHEIGTPGGLKASPSPVEAQSPFKNANAKRQLFGDNQPSYSNTEQFEEAPHTTIEEVSPSKSPVQQPVKKYPRR